MGIDWIIVKDSVTRKPLGAVGFIGDRLSVITAFYDDRDWNDDGKISLEERFLTPFSGKGRALAEVASQAYADPDILVRDPQLAAMRGQLPVQFASGMIVEGIYKVYFAQGISAAAGAMAGMITQSAIKSYFIKKGLESLVNKAYMESLQR